MVNRLPAPNGHLLRDPTPATVTKANTFERGEFRVFSFLASALLRRVSRIIYVARHHGGLPDVPHDGQSASARGKHRTHRLTLLLTVTPRTS